MTWISKATTAFGFLLLAHACYSAHEHSALQSHRSTISSLVSAQVTGTASSSSSGEPQQQPLPLDIALETVVATLVICLGLVAGTPPLRPIWWRVWAGQIEREGEDAYKTAGGETDKAYVGNPFRLLESRPGFVDIRRQRAEFTEWAKGQQ